MNQTGSLSNIMALIAFTLLVIILARLQPMTGFPNAMAAETQAQASADLHSASVSVATLANEQEAHIRAQCGRTHVQYTKLDGYKRCLAERQLGYEPTAWCPLVKTFCDAQWYPFGDKARCFAERGCPDS